MKLHGRRILGPLCVFVMVWSISCSGSGQTSGPYRAMEFVVDSTRLGHGIRLSQIEFRVPAGWATSDSTTLNQLREMSARDTSRFRFQLREVDVDHASGSLLFAKEFYSSGKDGFIPWARDLVCETRKKRPEADVREEWLLINGIPAVQIYAADSSRIQFSLVFDVKPSVGIDYIVPREAWEAQVRSVESSLGTLLRQP